MRTPDGGSNCVRHAHYFLEQVVFQIGKPGPNDAPWGWAAERKDLCNRCPGSLTPPTAFGSHYFGAHFKIYKLTFTLSLFGMVLQPLRDIAGHREEPSSNQSHLQ